jgi:GNAT superfamily N-acetyltransferase
MWENIGRWSRRDLDRADAPNRRWIRREMRAHRFFAFLYVVPDGRIAGSGAVWLQRSQPRPGKLAGETMPYIMSMFTEPEFRGHGIATELVRTMVRWVGQRGYRRVVLHASRFGRSVYEQLGFESSNEMRLDLPARRLRR